MQSPRAPRRRRPGLIIALAVAGVLVIVGIAAGAVLYVLRGSPEKVASKLPADTSVAFAAYLDPSASQKVNLLRLAHRFPAFSSDQRLSDTIDAALDDALGAGGLTSGDVKSWVGAEIGVGVRLDGQSVQTVAIVDSRDDAAAQASMDKVRAARSELQWSSVDHHGVTVWTGRSGETPSIVLALADHAVIASSDLELVNDVIDTATGDAPPLSDQAAYTAAVGRLPDGKLGFGYVNFQSITQAITGRLGSPGTSIGGAGVTGIDPSAFRSGAMALSAQPQGLVLDFTASIDPTRLTSAQRAALAASDDRHELLSWVPGDAYGVFAMTGLQRQIQSVVDRLPPEQARGLEEVGLIGPGGVLPHLTGEAAVEVGPGGEYPSGAVMLGGDDAAAMQRFLDRLGLLAAGAIQSREASSPAAATIPPSASVLAPLEAPPGETVSDSVSPWRELSYRGVRIRFLTVAPLAGAGVRPAYAVSDGVGIIASSPDEIKRALDARQGSSLPSAPAFESAMSSLAGVDESLLYLDVGGIASAIRDALPPDERAAYDSSVAPNLRPVESFVMGSADDVTTSSIRMVLLVR